MSQYCCNNCKQLCRKPIYDIYLML